MASLTLTQRWNKAELEKIKQADKGTMFTVWDHHRKGYRGPDDKGYYTKPAGAGHFTAAQATSILTDTDGQPRNYRKYTVAPVAQPTAKAPAVPMSEARAQHINSLLVGAMMASNGVGPETPSNLYQELRGISLADMVEASAIVRNGTGEKRDGYTIHTVHCDDRAVAAIYTAMHYEAETYGGPRAILSHEGEVLAKFRPRVG